MIFKGKIVPIVYSYQNGELVWDYVLPDELERTKYGFQVKPRDNATKQEAEQG